MIKVGDVFKTNRGGDCVVVEYDTNKSIIVEFCDEHKHRAKVTSNQLRKGDVKNPFVPVAFGVGFHGVGNYKAKSGSSREGYIRLPAYAAWMNMLSRCYDSNYKDPHLYKNSTIHEDWHCFQTFAEWYYKELSDLKRNGKSYLDKDILGNGKLYSDKSCCLVSPAINTIIKQVHGGKFLPGVRQSSNGLYRVVPGYECSEERFTLENDAHMAFVEAKSEKIKALAKEHKEFLRSHVYETLMTKDFRYKFSPFFEKSETLTG